ATSYPDIKQGSFDSNKRIFNAFGWPYTTGANHRAGEGAQPDGFEEVQTGVVPDIRGMGLRDALFYLGNAGYKAIVQGANGKVMTQSIQAGTQLALGSKVLIELK